MEERVLRDQIKRARKLRWMEPPNPMSAQSECSRFRRSRRFFAANFKRGGRSGDH